MISQVRSKSTTARNIYKKHGFTSLGTTFLAEDIPFGGRVVSTMSARNVKERMSEEEGLEDILDTVLEIQPGHRPYHVLANQKRREIRTLANIVKQENPEKILEIGTNNGGTFYIWCRFIDNLKKIISLDLPGGEFGGGYDENMARVFRSFSSTQMHLIRKNSHTEEAFNTVKNTLDSGDIDFLFIDGDHTYEGVKQDFEMYSKLVNDGGIIAFHDISSHPKKPNCNVNKYWKEIRTEYENVEIFSNHEEKWGGIGVIYI